MPLWPPDETGRDAEPPSAPLEECQLCHRPVPATEIVNLGTRRFCAGCAAAYYDDEAYDEPTE